MYVSKSTWLLAAIAIPLTMFTIVIWWLWIYWKPPHMVRRVCSVDLPEHHWKPFKSLFSRERRVKKSDIESAIKPPGHTARPHDFHSEGLCVPGASTWSTLETSTVKEKTEIGEDWGSVGI
jgi:hypothetical protein